MASQQTSQPAEQVPQKLSEDNSPTSSGSQTPVELEKQSEPLPTREIRGWKWLLFCLGIYATAILYGLDTTIVADVQASVIDRFGEIEKLGWLGMAFPLGSVATILPIGRLFGLYDIKWVYITSIALFEIGSAICGAAPTMDALIAGRVIAGVGGAGMYLGVLNYLSIFTTLRERSLYISLVGFIWGLGAVLGPVVGGAFSDSPATWRWAFYINLVIAAITAPIYIFLLPSFSARPNQNWFDKLRHLDGMGTLLNATIYVLFVVILAYGGITWSWSDGRIIAMWVVLGVLIIAFTLQQAFAVFTTVENRIFPVQFLKRRTFLLLFFATSGTAASLFIVTYYLPLFFQFARNDTAIDAAVRLLPAIIVAVTATMINGALMPVFGYYVPWYIASGVALLIGGPLMYTVSPDTSTSAMYGYSVLIAFGAGISMQAAYSIVAAKTKKPEDIPSAIGFINIAQLGGITLTLAIATSVFQNVGFKELKEAFAGYDFTDADLRMAIAGTRSNLFAGGDETVRRIALNAIVSTISQVYGLVIAAGALILVSAAVMKREKLFMTAAAGG